MISIIFLWDSGSCSIYLWVVWRDECPERYWISFMEPPTSLIFRDVLVMKVLLPEWDPYPTNPIFRYRWWKKLVIVWGEVWVLRFLWVVMMGSSRRETLHSPSFCFFLRRSIKEDLNRELIGIILPPFFPFERSFVKWMESMNSPSWSRMCFHLSLEISFDLNPDLIDRRKIDLLPESTFSAHLLW